jgi:hypothetical protein
VIKRKKYLIICNINFVFLLYHKMAFGIRSTYSKKWAPDYVTGARLDARERRRKKARGKSAVARIRFGNMAKRIQGAFRRYRRRGRSRYAQSLLDNFMIEAARKTSSAGRSDIERRWADAQARASSTGRRDYLLDRAANILADKALDDISSTPVDRRFKYSRVD